jgi:glucose/arabinose dehydrogenase
MRHFRYAAVVGLGVMLAGGVIAGEVQTSAGVMQISPVATGFEEPWALAFLPDGAVLVTERAGQLTLLRGETRQVIAGLPEVFARGQGGLLDVLVPRDFAQSREIWLSLAAPVKGGAATAVGRGHLSQDETRLEDFRLMFTAEGYSGGRHFGARLVEVPDGTLFLTTGDRGTGPAGMAAQQATKAAGKIIHLNRDGSPATSLPGWQPGVYSLGHRNVQGAELAPDGRLLTVEHGARGGDEVNAVQPGRNYGWPVISYGVNYDDSPIGEGTRKEGMEQPLHYWDPSIAPSGLMVYSGALVPDWTGDLFTGSLNSGFLSRLDPDRPAGTGFAEERIAAEETGRLRDVAEGPDGAIWFLSVENGALYRMAP